MGWKLLTMLAILGGCAGVGCTDGIEPVPLPTTPTTTTEP